MSLSHTQYLALLHTNDFFTRTGNRDNYSLVRRDILKEEAISGASLAAHPRALWRYGIRCIIRNIRRLKCTYNRDYLHSMWTLGQRYLQLYGDQLRGLALTSAQQTALRDCENVLPTLTVLVWRTLAEAQAPQVDASLVSHVVRVYPAATVVLLQLQRQPGSAASAAGRRAGRTASGLREDARPCEHQRSQVSARRRCDADAERSRGGCGTPSQDTTQDAAKESKAKTVKHAVARIPEHVLCCIFTNNVKMTLRVRYEGWEVGLAITNVAVKDYTSTHHKLKYLLRRSEDYYTSRISSLPGPQVTADCTWTSAT